MISFSVRLGFMNLWRSLVLSQAMNLSVHGDHEQAAVREQSLMDFSFNALHAIGETEVFFTHFYGGAYAGLPA